MTESGCQECGEDTYSGDGATICTKCPDSKVSKARSTSEDDCKFGKWINSQTIFLLDALIVITL